MRKTFTLALPIAALFCSSAYAEENALTRFVSIDQVVENIDTISGIVAANQLSEIDKIVISNNIALLGELRTTIGVTGYDTEQSFAQKYWNAYRQVFSAQDPTSSPFTMMQVGHFDETNFSSSASTWNSYFSENWQENSSDFSDLMNKAGIHDEASQARILAASVYYANLGRISTSSESPDEMLVRWPTYIWPMCKTDAR